MRSNVSPSLHNVDFDDDPEYPMTFTGDSLPNFGETIHAFHSTHHKSVGLTYLLVPRLRDDYRIKMVNTNQQELEGGQHKFIVVAVNESSKLVELQWVGMLDEHERWDEYSGCR